ncbi:MAG: cell envelope biogenesis protein OmpA [Muricauda sp.]|nr:MULTISPECIES: OmpA family protein [unclassified Allomuricauda]MAU14707.1 cell envelope biogenesis protein OmpA [Allomuricauda sp.]|tara:strand:- start:44391 stop:46448 length:2058 start_codon:yes stop_codon:yes gene_type:complete
MKRLILLFFLSCSLGIYAQELALSDYGKEASMSNNEQYNNDYPPEDAFIKHLDGLSDKRLHKYLSKKGASEKLIQKGNEYFDKMWYAEAARIFDIVLEKTDTEHTLPLLSKAGDSHYYSGNLEKAYKWYDELYQLYQDEIPDDTIFKYAQTLKGTGKYRRAATLTKILKEKRNEPLNELNNLETNTWNGASSVKIKNLDINSKYSDFSPMFHNGNDIVYASAKDSSILTTRRYRWTNQPFLDLYVAKRKNDEGDLFGPKKFSNKINTKFHEASLAFSPDQKTIYFTRNNYGKRLKRGKNGINHLKIYRSQYSNGTWTEAEELPFNSEDYSTGHPTVSLDGKKMYFVSDRPGGFGDTDIYVVDILENGAFSEPKNLGRTINTNTKEMFPYVTENALYFSSNKAKGFGGLDIYRSEGANGVFNEPINLGQPFNSNRDDFSFIIDSTGTKGYFASNRTGGKGDDDIYSFTYTPNFNTITGAVENTSGEAIEQASIMLFQEGDLLKEVIADGNGEYSFDNLDPTTNYTIVAKKEGFINDSLTVKTKDNKNIKTTHRLKEQKKVSVDKPIVETFKPGNVYFGFDSYKITASSAKELDKLIAVLKENQDLSLKIKSYTDAIGPTAYNKYLSEKRAQSTKDYIVSQGVDPSRIVSAVGYGEEEPLNNCIDGQPCPADQHRLNRRSEFILISE